MTIEEIEKQRLVCEGTVNKSWFAAEKYKDDIREVVERDMPYNEKDILLLRVGANAFLSKVILADLENTIQDKVNEA